MPELPDVVVYVESLDQLVTGRVIQNVRVRSPFVLRTFTPMIEDAVGQSVVGFSRRGKRIVWHLESLHLVFHPMIAGRFHWKKAGYAARGKNDLLVIDFEHGVMAFTEASKKKRAGAWVFKSIEEVDAMDPGGLDLQSCSLDEFAAELKTENRTLKRMLTDPKRFDGIGNAYSDEILHAARLSPLKRTSQLNDPEVAELFEACQVTLATWIDRLREKSGGKFPEKVTAFHHEMTVHGKFGDPCPVCGAPIQRIRYAENECNYCAGCQTDGKILSDRSLARLLKDDWPQTLDDLDSG